MAAERASGRSSDHRDRETIAISDNSLCTGLRTRLSDIFPLLVPRKPYCTDDPKIGLTIRSQSAALQRRHIQLNGPHTLRWMVHDLDDPEAAFAHDDANLPEPNVITINPANRHAHSAILLAVPVAKHNAARAAPLRYFAAVERGIARRLKADQSYCGLIAKNPLHSDWRVEWRRDHPFTLPELADWLFPRDMAPEQDRSSIFGVGRNVTIFDDLRHIAYREVRSYKSSGHGPEAFHARCMEIARNLNHRFKKPLAASEIASIAKSVAKWSWRNFSEPRFRQLQSMRGRKGNTVRWAGHAAASETKPWEALGISRATYYRRRNLVPAGVLLLSQQPTDAPTNLPRLRAGATPQNEPHGPRIAQ